MDKVMKIQRFPDLYSLDFYDLKLFEEFDIRNGNQRCKVTLNMHLIYIVLCIR